MRSHVLLSLLNGLGIRDKMRGLPSILSFCNMFNTFKIQEHECQMTKNDLEIEFLA